VCDSFASQKKNPRGRPARIHFPYPTGVCSVMTHVGFVSLLSDAPAQDGWPRCTWAMGPYVFTRSFVGPEPQTSSVNSSFDRYQYSARANATDLSQGCT
jgi:hypothetical protein